MTSTIVALANPAIGGAFGASATGINASGEVVGYINTATDSYLVVWQNGQTSVTDLSSVPALLGAVINDQGEIAGSASVEPFTLLNGLLTPLSDPGHATVYGINNQGVIVGHFSNGGPDSAVEWLLGVPTELTPLPGNPQLLYEASANGINNSGEIVGTSNGHATLWRNGVPADLGVLSLYDSSTAYAINDQGEIAGTDISQLGHDSIAVVWKNGAISRLENLPGAYDDYASGLNDAGVVVGKIQEFQQYYHAVAWIDGQVIDLNSLLPANSGWVLQDATGINDSGVIVGTGTYNGVNSSFELTLGSDPTPLFVTASAALAADVTTPVAIRDSAANVASHIDALQAMIWSGNLSTVTLSDPGTPILSLTTGEAADSGLFDRITGPFSALITPASSGQILGVYGALGTIVAFSGPASAATLVVSDNGAFMVTAGGLTESLPDVQALQFSDTTLIVAQTPGPAGAVTTGNVTELYGAVLAREPDVPGLAFYQNYLEANPNTPLLQFAAWFLSSSEYASAHNYSQTSAGDAQFIGDSYHNLLHRTPSAAEIAFYQDSVMAPALNGLTAGTQAYAAAEFQAHAQMLVYFSASPEFLSDVQVTATNPASAQHWLVLI